MTRGGAGHTAAKIRFVGIQMGFAPFLIRTSRLRPKGRMAIFFADCVGPSRQVVRGNHLWMTLASAGKDPQGKDAGFGVELGLEAGNPQHPLLQTRTGRHVLGAEGRFLARKADNEGPQGPKVREGTPVSYPGRPGGPHGQSLVGKARHEEGIGRRGKDHPRAGFGRPHPCPGLDLPRLGRGGKTDNPVFRGHRFGGQSFVNGGRGNGINEAQLVALYGGGSAPAI